MSTDTMFYLNAEMRRNKIQLTYVYGGEIKYAEIDNYQPTLYGRTFEDNPQFTELVSGKGLTPTQFKSIREANNVIRAAREDDSVEIFGNRDFAQTFVRENFGDCSSKYDPNLIHGAFIDIECPTGDEGGFPHVEHAAHEINAMAVYHTGLGKYYVWGKHTFCINVEMTKLLRNENITKDDVVYFMIDNEKDRLNHFLKWWRKNFPAYISGWNTSKFDIPYMCHRFRNLGIDMNLLSPWKSVTVREGTFYGKPEFTVKIGGIADLDYIELYKKNRFITRESYKLDFIASVELDRQKVDYSEVASNLRTLHKKDWDLFVTYNVIDVGLVKALDDKLGFLDITFAVAYYAGINYDMVKSPVATWEAILYKELIQKNIILPNKQEHEAASYEGGYVKAPQVGKHKWVLSFDLNSLYPSIIRQWNISFEQITNIVVPDIDVDTMTEALPYNKPEYDLAVCPSGYTFKKDKQGVAGIMMEKLYNERRTIKDEMLDHEQKAVNAKAELKKRGLL